uniref:Polyprotein n=1 Tax=Globodera pallida TaxID=36090 RepID=A0A183CQX5_GLOPA
RRSYEIGTANTALHHLRRPCIHTIVFGFVRRGCHLWS